MNPSPFIPDNAPFSPEQRAWLNGFLAGMFSTNGEHPAGTGSPISNGVHKAPLAILYGSQSGNAEAFSKRLGKEAAKKGFEPKVIDMAQFRSLDLKKESRLLLVSSTWGEGEMPDNAKEFWDHLKSSEAPQLQHLSFSVLAFGDTNYGDTFCQAGKDFDLRLEELGAKRIFPRIDCDVDYEAKAREWIEGVFANLPSGGVTAPASSAPSVSTKTEEAPAPSGYSKKNPFPAPLLTNRNLNGKGSAKDVRHIEFSLENSGLSYEVGDALGVFPVNDAALVDALLPLLSSPETPISISEGQQVSLKDALLHHFEITKITPQLLECIAEKTNNAEIQRLLRPEFKEDLKDYLWGRDPLDLLQEYPDAVFTAVEFCQTLKKLQPRLYSISSSPKAHPGQVHLTVGAVRYSLKDRARGGVCSTFLADRLSIGSPAGVFVQASHGFKLPASGDVPIIMVGPGTGIAPFRAFLEERRAVGAKGKSWLFFGDQKESTDFLYRDELEAMMKEGSLTHLHTAFSRDQKEKIYVQDRMRQNGAEIWKWLQEGAHFYVCGDASRMAKDVDTALHEICKTEGRLSADQATDFVKKLKSDKRYQRDVY